jgi:membrane-associated phospholipid phosphatase
MHLQFSMEVMNWFADHRTPFLTQFFLFFTNLGEIDGYILVATLIYVMFDKALAVRLTVLVLLTMELNHLIKIVIKNPRPFVREGTYGQEWAVSPENARDLITEYSTPSGHAMACAAFYSFLYSAVKSRAVRIAAVVLIVLIGLSRPYLGVHYLEDVLLGWIIGLLVALIAIFRGEHVAAGWTRLSHAAQAVILVGGSLALCAVTVAINGGKIDSQPRAFLAYAGALTGVLLARPVELRLIDFDPKSANVSSKVLRYVLTLVFVLFSLYVLKLLFERVAADYSLSGYALQYFRYVIAGGVDIFVAPLLFTRLGLASASSASATP